MSRNVIYQKKIETLLSHADVRIGAGREWDLEIHNPDTYARILGGGTLGLGEAYMESWRDCLALDQFFTRVLQARLAQRVHTVNDKLFFVKTWLMNRQAGKRSLKVAQQHYDAGNDLYQRMLDKRMIYSYGIEGRYDAPR
ncbi:MAG: hypothetical protein COA42_12005 [Alteromonadaceae bacterium]|nr:MAG: hypothetical protein COA42_12005 [Alteromonadaceae bacterium]